MATIRVFILALLLLVAPPALARDTAEKVFNADVFTLKNGMQVVVIPNTRAPVVTHMVWYRAGAADETPGHSGVAHFMEHLMFKGSEGLGPGEFSRKVRAMGGNDNAFTSRDYTAYFQSVPAEHLETVMKMEAGRMRGMTLPPDQVDSERLVILEERRQRTDNDPRAQMGEQLYASLFVNHPYGTPVIGWLHEMAQITREDAKAFYDTHYGPNNAILVVSGDVTGAQVKALAEKIYGPLEPVPVPERNWMKSPPLAARSLVTMRHPSIRQPVVQILVRGPSNRSSREDYLALQALEDIIGNGSTSRLYKSLVIEQKIATNVGFSYDGDSWDDGIITMYASPAPGIGIAQAEEALKNELRKVIAEGVTEEELRAAKTRMQDAAVFARDSLSGPAMIFGRALVTGSTVDQIEYWPRDVEAVTAAQVQDVARRYLDPDAAQKNPVVTGYLLPPEEKAPEPMAGEEQKEEIAE